MSAPRWRLAPVLAALAALSAGPVALARTPLVFTPPRTPPRAPTPLARPLPRKPLFPPRPTTPTVSRTVTNVETLVSEVNPSSWPRIKLPVFSAKPPPSPLPEQATDLRLIDARSSGTASGGLSSVAKTTPLTSARVALVGLGVLSVGWSPDMMNNSGMTVSCSASTRSGPRSLFWQILRREPDGSARLLLGEGWFDAKECRVLQGSQVELTLAAVASADGVPVLFGARTDEGLQLFLPPTQGNEVELTISKSRSPTQHGPLMRASLAPARGTAEVFSATIPGHSLATWRRSLLGTDSPTPSAVLLPTNVRLDVSQSLSESTPVALVTVQHSVSTEVITTPLAPASVGAPGSGLSSVLSRGTLIDPF